MVYFTRIYNGTAWRQKRKREEQRKLGIATSTALKYCRSVMFLAPLLHSQKTLRNTRKIAEIIRDRTAALAMYVKAEKAAETHKLLPHGSFSPVGPNLEIYEM